MQLQNNELQERAKELSRDNLKFIYGIIKAISLTAGTIALINIFYQLGSQDNIEDYKPFILQILLFFTSWLVVLVSYDGVMTSTLFAMHMPKLRETVFTFALVILELLLFFVFSPKYFITTGDTVIKKAFGLEIISYWFLFFSLNAFVGNRMLHYALEVTVSPNAEYQPSIRPIINKYRKSIKIAKLHSFWSFFITLLFFIYIFYNRGESSSFFKILEISYAATLLISMSVIFYKQHKDRGNLLKQ